MTYETMKQKFKEVDLEWKKEYEKYDFKTLYKMYRNSPKMIEERNKNYLISRAKHLLNKQN